ncbi:hypothetical protein [Streptomyces anulatus]|uniref:hypothetical protein n=1 Tax=Streptomyces anulatus TaxID=1892 RepID=UPI002F909C39|nr:hypothetical protein OH791_38160 [Streptomyces anulatus]
MARISPSAQEILGKDFLNTVNASDRCDSLCEVVATGWVLDEGATLLSAFRESYVGDRASFSGIGSYEAAVNGRGIPDLDLTGTGDEQIRMLMRRGTAFAWDALHATSVLPWAPPLLARISAAPVLMDPDTWTGYGTFFSSQFEGDLGLDANADLPGIQIVLSSIDCANPLPVM